MARIRVGLCQLNTVVGDLDGNVERVITAYDEAEAAGCDLAVFPELAITGYPPEDLVLKPRFVEANRDALDKVASRTGRCAAVVGFVDADRDLYNAAAMCAGGDVLGTYRKRLLPNYAVFDEQRYFAPGDNPLTLFEIAGVKVGIAICEDVWSPEGSIADQSAGGAELIVIPNGSPYFEGRHVERERMVATRAEDAHCHIVYVNLVGGQDELIFDGTSFVVDDNGDLLARAPQLREHLQIVDLDIRPVFRTRLLDPRGPRHGAGASRRRTCRIPPSTTPNPRGRSRSLRCSIRSPRSTTRSCSPRATTSRRTASPTSCSASRVGSTPRSSP